MLGGSGGGGEWEGERGREGEEGGVGERGGERGGRGALVSKHATCRFTEKLHKVVCDIVSRFWLSSILYCSSVILSSGILKHANCIHFSN